MPVSLHETGKDGSFSIEKGKETNMLVRLPRQCSGQEIVEAFKTAATIQEKPEKQWQPREFVKEYQYEPGSARQTVRSMGVKVLFYYLRKKWGLFGKKVWKPNSNPEFTLFPVILSHRYDDVVEVTVRYVYDVGQAGDERVATDPHTPEFEHVRPQFEKILGNFFARLQS